MIESPSLAGLVKSYPGLYGGRWSRVVVGEEVDLLFPQLLGVLVDELRGRNLVVEPRPLVALEDVPLHEILLVSVWMRRGIHYSLSKTGGLSHGLESSKIRCYSWISYPVY